ncbi:MAG: VWA domain-containing protein [Candidatus Omnitrophota bacterium]
MHFNDPWILILLLLVLAAGYYQKRRKREPAVIFSSGELLQGLKPSFKVRLSKNIIFLRIAALLLIVIALARPQSALEETRIITEGIDIVLAVDVSTSMLAEDFKLGNKRQNRLEVVKDVVTDFINGRQYDRIGLVVFGSRAYTVCPLTLDYGWLLQNLERVKIGMVEDGTAVGSGIMSSLDRLKDTKAKGKVVILLTDGRNNSGKVSPFTAAEAAQALKVKVYTIGAGSKGLVPYPARDFFGNTVYQSVEIDIDEDSLIKIAAKTNAQYFRATDTQSLREIYKTIDKLEKTPIEEKGYMEYKELFYLFLIPAVVLICLEIVLGNTVLRRIP